MANVYYDPTTWKPFADQSQYGRFDESYGHGTGWQNYQIGPEGQSYIPEGGIGYGDPFQDYLKQRFAISPRTQQWLKGIEGMTPEKAEAAIQNYFSQTGNTWNDFRFWGDDAMLRAVGMGMPADVGGGPDGTWKSLWNQGRELAGQKDIAQDYQSNEEAMGSDMGDVMSMLPGILAVVGAGGLAGAFSGAGGFGSNMLDPSAWAGFDASLGGGSTGALGSTASASGTLADVIGSDWAAGLPEAMNAGAQAGSTAGATGGAIDPTAWSGFDASLGSGADAAWGVNPQTAGGNMFDLDIGGIDDLISGWNGGGGAPWDSLPDLPNSVFTGTNSGLPGAGSAGASLPSIPNGLSSVVNSIFGGGGGNNQSGGLLGNGIGALLQYLNGQNTSGQYNNLMQQLLQQGNPFGQPQRQPFIQAATNNLPMSSFLQNYGSPIANFYSERLNPAVAKSGDLTNSLAANQNGFAREIMGEYNKTLGTLGALGGFTQQNNAVPTAGAAGASGIAASNAGQAAGLGAIGQGIGQVVGGVFNNQNQGTQNTNPISNVTTIWNP